MVNMNMIFEWFDKQQEMLQSYSCLAELYETKHQYFPSIILFLFDV